MTFTAGNLFLSHSCIGWPDSSPHWDLKGSPAWESDDLSTELSLPLNKSYLIYSHDSLKQTKIVSLWFKSIKYGWHFGKKNVPFCKHSVLNWPAWINLRFNYVFSLSWHNGITSKQCLFNGYVHTMPFRLVKSFK